MMECNFIMIKSYTLYSRLWSSNEKIKGMYLKLIELRENYIITLIETYRLLKKLCKFPFGHFTWLHVKISYKYINFFTRQETFLCLCLSFSFFSLLQTNYVQFILLFRVDNTIFIYSYSFIIHLHFQISPADNLLSGRE